MMLIFFFVLGGNESKKESYNYDITQHTTTKRRAMYNLTCFILLRKHTREPNFQKQIESTLESETLVRFHEIRSQGASQLYVTQFQKVVDSLERGKKYKFVKKKKRGIKLIVNGM
jgi:hypothetical protein